MFFAKMNRRNQSIPHFSSVALTFPTPDRSETKRYELKSYRQNQIFHSFRLLSLRVKLPEGQKSNGMESNLTDETGHSALFVCKVYFSGLWQIRMQSV